MRVEDLKKVNKVEISPEIDILMRLRELFEDKNKWGKGWFFMDKAGAPTDMHNAYSFCIIGGVHYLSYCLSDENGYPNYGDICIILQNWLIKNTNFMTISGFNDDLQTDYEDVINMIDGVMAEQMK